MKGVEKNLFLITAPYQMLSALEAVHQLSLDQNHLRVIDTGHFTQAQFDCVIDPAQWESVCFHRLHYRCTDRDFGVNPPKNLKEKVIEKLLIMDQGLKRIKANQLARDIGEVGTLVMGNYRRDYDGHMRHLANRIPHKHLLLLDVGTDTLAVNQDRHLDRKDPGGTSEKRMSGNGNSLKGWLKDRLVKWDTEGAPSVTFFSTYDLDLAPGDKAIKNSYAYLQEVVANTAPSRDVLFVGQPLVDQSYLDADSFIQNLRYIQNYFDGQRLVYIQHPRESREQLQLVQDLNIPIKRFSAPFEYAVSLGGQRPAGIATFFSSALENCAVIFGLSIKTYSFRLPEAQLLKNHKEVERVYRLWAEQADSGITLIDLPITAGSVVLENPSPKKKPRG